tara:strand:- start:38 stop:901 length:864 start_codon:yes stop_codon:yes gene_type:complete
MVDTFNSFGQSKKAQDVIDQYLNTSQSEPDINSAGNFRNPIFDLRTEQGLSDEALYPNPQMDFSAEDDPVDPCQEGFMLVDGICQPIETFGQSMYDEDDRDDPEERPYMSIEEMKNANDYELLKYLDDGWLKGDKFNATLGGSFMPWQFALPFGNQNKMRRDFIINELTRRGYATGVNDKDQNTFNLGNAFGIISNAEAANQGGNRLATNQLSIFTPEEINYQIQQANNQNQGNYQAPTMTEQQVIEDAKKSGGSVNQFEAQNINAYTPPPQPPFAVNYEDVYGADI